MIGSYLFGPLGKDALSQLTPQTDRTWIDQHIGESMDLMEDLKLGHAIGLGQYSDVRPILARTQVENYTLTPDESTALMQLLTIFSALDKMYEKGKKRWVYLNALFNYFDPCASLYKQLLKYLEPDGTVKDDATPELLKIAQRERRVLAQIDGAFNKALKKYQQLGMLADSQESTRSGRRVLSVRSENKRAITGIIHDQSESGKTTYIEPDELVFLNNDLQQIYQDRKKEIYKILRTISAHVRLYREQITAGLSLIGSLDLAHAKAKLAIQYDGVHPTIENKQIFVWYNAVHPLLFLKNEIKKEKTVRFDFNIHGQNRVVLLSGPNAGGKSITMKSVGLNQVMMQCGIPVPMKEDSIMGIFHDFFLDIGDQQSIEDELSTYSSRLKNMEHILRKADAKSLVLMDEYGSGSDPLLGAAVAEAWLDAFLKKKSWGVLTTHYNNLKIYAYKNRGVINGSMLFNRDNLSATYQLRLGKPGSSYTLEIAEKSGLPKDLIKYAKKRIGKKAVGVEDLLVSLQNEKIQLEDKIKALEQQKNKLDKLVENYNQLNTGLEIKKKKLKLEKKSLDYQDVADRRKALEHYIRELKKEKSLDRVQKKLKKLKVVTKEHVEELKEIKEDVFVEDLGSNYTFSVGDFVKVVGTDTAGQIDHIQKNKATISTGLLKLTVPLEELRPTREHLNIKNQRSVKLQRAGGNTAFVKELDIRGYTPIEARDHVTRLIDDALMTEVYQLKIIHGKGSGKLRRITAEVAKEYKAVSSVSHPPADQGGDGITLVSF